MGSMYLCSTPTLWSGMARLLDFGNTFDAYNRAANGSEADGLGMLWDWAMVGEDLWSCVDVVYSDSESRLTLAKAKHGHELVVR